MNQRIKITDLRDPRLDIYARLSEVQLLRYAEPAPGIFIGESPKVIRRALVAGYKPISFLVADLDLDREALEILEQWQEIYRKRLQNDKIPRKLTTVARNLWEKLTVEERFVKPLIQLLEMKKDIAEGAKFIKKLIECGTEDEELSQIKEKLMEIWNVCPEGEILFNMIDKISD